VTAEGERLILVVEDEPQVVRFLKASLSGHGFRILDAPTGQTGLVEASARVPDLVLLDLGLPDMDGVAVARRLREWTSVPIIVLSARGQERDKIEALDAGADDYLTKPFGIGELLARIRVALRHADRVGDGAEASELTVGDLRIDLGARRVFAGGAEVHLTPIEYRLLALLVKNAGKVVTQRQLLKEVWGPGAVEHSHYLRVYMGQLRHKLEAEPARPRWLITEPGVGYRLKTD
jgi:two-component system, OmpR family, KDP operon response regulator KdpE